MFNFLTQLLIFIKGSRTFFYTSLFFPSKIRNDVFTLYSFVRTIDDYVDILPQQKKSFTLIKQEILAKQSSNPLVVNFLNLAKRKKIPLALINNFLNSMEMDLYKKTYHNKELDKYIHGSSETIGQMMAIILSLPPKSYKHARLLGRSLQFINFIRDIQEDNDLGRTYFSSEDLKKFKLKNLKKTYIENNPENFKSFIRFQIKKYLILQLKAEKGYQYIPRKSLIPIKTASDMYKYTALEIYQNPEVIYTKKIKPAIWKILITLISNSLKNN